ncbi:ABC transporter permease subunit [Shewanella sp. YIC-542]|uniref:ABC transporter permease subunit n=1 Tax=Shewanella mytili TaxID=3377111 RepID=UPI00398EF5F3
MAWHNRRFWWPLSGLLLLSLYCLWQGSLPISLDLLAKSQAPSWAHWLGTDWLGRDMARRSAAAMLKSLWVGIFAVVLSSTLALCLALLAQLGKQGRRWVLLACDLCMSLPHLLLLILLALAFGGQAWGVIAALSLTHWPRLTRLLLFEMEEVLAQPYVTTALSFGGNPLLCRLRHLWPHVLPQWFIGTLSMFPHALLHVAALSFLGFGLDSQSPSMGELLAEANRYLLLGQWWLALFPGLLLVLYVLLFSALAECLIDKQRPHPCRFSAPDEAPAVASVANDAEKTSAPLAVIEDLTLTDATGQPLIEHLQLTLNPGKMYCLLGESGGGKSLLALAMLGAVPQGLKLCCKRRLLPPGTVLCPQSGSSLDANLTVGAVLDWYCAAALKPHKSRILQQLGLSALLHHYPPMLSGGQTKRVLLALALLQEPRLLVADEPCCGLDETAAREVYHLLQAFATGDWQRQWQPSKAGSRGMSHDDPGHEPHHDNRSVLVISHNLQAVLATHSQVLFMHSGRIKEQCPAHRLNAAPEGSYARLLYQALPDNWPLAEEGLSSTQAPRERQCQSM